MDTQTKGDLHQTRLHSTRMPERHHGKERAGNLLQALRLALFPAGIGEEGGLMSVQYNRWNYNLFVKPTKRIVSWFSNGAASFTATLAALNKYGDIEIVNCDPGREHPDNKRFL